MSTTSPWPQYSRSVPSVFFDRAGRWGDDVVLRCKRDGAWQGITWRECEQHVLAVAAGLLLEGAAPRSRVAILSGNRPEWLYLDYAALSVDVIDVPIYPTNTAEQIAFILEDSGAELIFVENQKQLDKVLKVRDRLPALRRAVVIEPSAATDPFVTDLAAFAARGRAQLDRAAIGARLAAIDPEEAATLIYTSGTTGNPKGVMLSHRNLVSNIDAVQDHLTIQAGDTDLQFLPMCHAFGRMEVYALIMHHGTVNFAESIEKLPANFKEVRPRFFVTVPRMLEKIYEKVVAGLEAASPFKRQLFWWAIEVGKRHTQHRMDGTTPGLLDRLQYPIADRLVFSKVKEAFGGRIRVIGYAAAPLAVEIQRFFAAAGITAMEAYGLTETSPGLSGNKAHDFRLGSVGKPAPDTEIQIAPDGEILARGPQVMLGYWNQPAATAEALEGGWFHTGDIGKIDADGFLWITDRKKDLIITAGGKNIAPQNIENLFKLNPAVEQIAVMGDRHNYLVALIVPSQEWLTKFAAERGLAGDRAAWVKDAKVRAEFERLVAANNKSLAQYETIKKFELLAEEFNVENELLTPTMKVRRKSVASRYADLIESMYK